MENSTTPDAVFETLTRLFPAFAAQCCDPGSLFISEYGTFTYCGLFCELTNYVRDHFKTMPAPQRVELFNVTEGCITNHVEDELDTAVCTCFLENLAGEELSSELRRYMGPKALAFFNQWDNQIAEDC